jgi:hypothetical protein
MIPVLRDRFNKAFSEEKYLQLIREIDSIRPGSLEFRIAETPVFIDKKIEARNGVGISHFPFQVIHAIHGNRP